MNKRGILFVSILLILVSSAYAVSTCDTRCKNNGYEFGTCGSDMDSSAWIEWGPTGWGPTGCDNSQICYCKISTSVSPPQTGQSGSSGGGPLTTIINLFTSQKYDVPSGKTGSMVCDELGGVCREIECLKSQIIFNVWGSCGSDQENRMIDCSYPRNSIKYNKVRASCSCAKENVCYNGMSYERNSDCTLGKMLDSCAAKDMKCSGGECAGCIDGFYEENGACIYGTRPTTIPAGDEAKENSCDSPPMEDYKRINTETNLLPTKPNQEWIYDGETPYAACSWRCDSGYTYKENGYCACTSNCRDGTTCSSNSNCASNYCNPATGKCQTVECLPTNEICDGKDNDCDGQIDENVCPSNICQLTSAKIELQGTDNKADPGDKIRIIATITGDCSELKKIQIDAKDSSGQCTLQHSSGKIAGIDGSITQSQLTAEWIIPNTIPTECQDKLITPYSAGLYKNTITSNDYIDGIDNPIGSFTFAPAPGTQNCGDGTNDAEEVCDKQLTPTKSCISINSDLYSGGEATCKQDCSGWDITTCIQKTITTGCGNGIVETGLGEECDCGTDNICSDAELNNKDCQEIGRPAGRLSCYDSRSTDSPAIYCKLNPIACGDSSRQCTQDEQCTTSDGCQGEKRCVNGVFTGCIKTEANCPAQPTCTELTCTTSDNCPGKQRCVDGVLSTVCTKDNPDCPTIVPPIIPPITLPCPSQSNTDLSIPATNCICDGTLYQTGWCCKGKYQEFIPCDQTQLSALSAAFTYEINGTTATFTAANQVLPYFEWDFGDGNKQEGGQRLYTISHKYIFAELEKSFNVTLTVRNINLEEKTESVEITIEKSILDLPTKEMCNLRGNDLEGCHSQLDGCFFGSECESCAVVSKCEDFSDDELACTGEIPGCDRYACEWDNLCLPAQVSEQDCQYVCINLNDYPNYYFNGKKEYPQRCETGTCWECPTEGCKFTSPDGTTTITYIDGECVNGFKEVTIKNSGIAQDQKIIQPCSLSPVIPFFSLFNIVLTLSILTVFYLFRKKF